jgi:hypothetical protein
MPYKSGEVARLLDVPASRMTYLGRKFALPKGDDGHHVWDGAAVE